MYGCDAFRSDWQPGCISNSTVLLAVALTGDGNTRSEASRDTESVEGSGGVMYKSFQAALNGGSENMRLVLFRRSINSEELGPKKSGPRDVWLPLVGVLSEPL